MAADPVAVGLRGDMTFEALVRHALLLIGCISDCCNQSQMGFMTNLLHKIV